MKECALRFQFLRSEQFSPNCSGGSSGTDQLVQSMDGFSGHFPRAYSHHRNDDGRRSRSGWRGPWAGQGGATDCDEESPMTVRQRQKAMRAMMAKIKKQVIMHPLLANSK